MRLHGMGMAGLANSEQAADLSFEERMALLVGRQFVWRQNEGSRRTCGGRSCAPPPAGRMNTIPSLAIPISVGHNQEASVASLRPR